MNMPKTNFFKHFQSCEWLLAGILILALSAPFVEAQECSSHTYKRTDRMPILKDMVNPKPFKDDFELPMPCGTKLILRYVCVPAKNFFEDLQLNLGCWNCGRPQQGFMETKHMAPLAGAFRLSDLPASWHAKLKDIARSKDGRCPHPNNQTSAQFYYFIGKYEISNYQWKAVMDKDCPGWNRPFTADDPRPKTNISWFEAVEFTRRYTEWLLKNRSDCLPKFADGRFGYIRLPTEAEWEYAARGGHCVAESKLELEEFFPLQNRPLSAYAVYSQEDAAKPPEKLAWIGTKCPNPLGLFDTAGNAAEMMLEPFRFSVANRLHGAAGGFVIKGGSYRKGRSEIMPGRREEMPYFLGKNAFRSTDLGFRVVVSGIVTPATRTKALRAQWAAISQKSSLHQPLSNPSNELDASQDLLSEIERVAATTSDNIEKKNLLLILNFLQKNNAARTEKKRKMVRGLIWKALFASDSILEYALQRRQLQNDLEKLKKLESQALPEAEFESLKGNISDLRKQIRSYDVAINYFVKLYINSIQSIKELPEKVVNRQINSIFAASNLDEKIKSALTRQLDLLKQHLTLSKDLLENLIQKPETITADIILTATLQWQKP